MLETALGLTSGFTAPHRIATKAGADVLQAGGSAIEAMVAAAAVIAVVYPHMNGIGGDGFWLIHRPGQAPAAISACGPAAALATVAWYGERGHDTALPARGPHAALTVPGTIGGWIRALDLVAPDRRLPLADLLAPAIALARGGFAVSRNQSVTTEEKLSGLQDVTGFADTFLIDGQVPRPGAALALPALAETLAHLAENGLEAFYDGEVAAANARFLEAQDSPLRGADFAAYAAENVTPLSIQTGQGRLYNMVPPTQGMSSLAILGIFDRLGVREAEGFDHVHGLVEATKQAFLVRNAELGDPRHMTHDAQALLADSNLDAMAAAIDRTHALPWPHVAKDGDTIWMGAADRNGIVVSFIQSVFWEFGSGLICPETGIMFQNRGAGFSLTKGPNQLAPGKRPFHTLNPALAVLPDGRVMSYGTMGGEGQPQTQAAVFTRYAQFGASLQAAITRPRWLLGKTWGDDTTSLKLEANTDPGLCAALARAGHEVEMIPEFSSLVGHAGAIVRHPDGRIEAANDPRSDGLAYAE